MSLLDAVLCLSLRPVVALWTAEAAAADASADGNPGCACVPRRRAGLRAWRSSGVVSYTLVASLHLAHSTWEHPEPDAAGRCQQTPLHYRWVTCPKGADVNMREHKSHFSSAGASLDFKEKRGSAPRRQTGLYISQTATKRTSSTFKIMFRVIKTSSTTKYDCK